MTEHTGRGVYGGSLVGELRHAVRRLANRPAASSTAVLTLSLAIGAAVSMFGVIDRTLIRPLDVPDPSRLVTVRQPADVGGVEVQRTGMWWSVYERMLAIPWSTLSAIGASSDRIAPDVEVQFAAFGDDAPIERVRGLFVTANYFRVLGLRPAAGRDFAPVDDTAGAPPTAMLSHRVWRARFGSDDAIPGRTIHVNGVTVRIIGVAPPGFGRIVLGGAPPELYFPLHAAPRLLEASGVTVAPEEGRIFFGDWPNAVASPVSPIMTFGNRGAHPGGGGTGAGPGGVRRPCR